MAGSVNKAIILGNVGKDPEIKSFQNGGRIANFSIATSESWKDKASGEKKERTEWHNISVQSDGLVGVVERYIKKGSKLYIEGQIRTRKWQDKDGNDRYSTEVVLSGPGAVLTMLDSAGGNRGGGSSGNAGGASDGWSGSTSSGAGTGGGSPFPDDDLNDDVPF